MKRATSRARILTARVGPTRTELACIHFDFHVDAEDPNAFVFFENWRSKEDLDTHLKTPHLRPLFDRLDELLARPVEIKFYTMLSRRDF
jgi:quinol monooxygenase YgiN